MSPDLPGALLTQLLHSLQSGISRVQPPTPGTGAFTPDGEVIMTS